MCNFSLWVVVWIVFEYPSGHFLAAHFSMEEEKKPKILQTNVFTMNKFKRGSLSSQENRYQFFSVLLFAQNKV